jgi:hypothetical protein
VRSYARLNIYSSELVYGKIFEITFRYRVSLVNLVENWEVLEEYAENHKRGFYQTIGDAKNVEIRVAVGGLGFKKEFDNTEDSSLNRILNFCKSQKYIKISENIRDEYFFK